MMFIPQFKSIFGRGLVVGCLCVGLVIGAVSEAQADDDRQFDVAMISCQTIEPAGVFVLDDIAANNDTDRNVLIDFRVNPTLPIGTPCPVVLRYLLGRGYEPLEGGSGVTAADDPLVVHFGYTFTKSHEDDDD